MVHGPLVDAATLAQHLNDPHWVAVDCRFNLLEPNAGRDAYQRAHIPGARYADLDRDLARAPATGEGRHPLPEPDLFAARLGQWGIGDESDVVAYDEGSGAIAARLWWMLRWLGHERSLVLNGGFAAWTRQRSCPWSATLRVWRPAVYTLRQVGPAAVVTTARAAAAAACRTPRRRRTSGSALPRRARADRSSRGPRAGGSQPAVLEQLDADRAVPPGGRAAHASSKRSARRRGRPRSRRDVRIGCDGLPLAACDGCRRTRAGQASMPGPGASGFAIPRPSADPEPARSRGRPLGARLNRAGRAHVLGLAAADMLKTR